MDNRWEDALAAGDVGRAIRWRFDPLVEALGLDRKRTLAWTLGRVLQNSLWDIQDGAGELQASQVTMARVLSSRLCAG